MRSYARRPTNCWSKLTRCKKGRPAASRTAFLDGAKQCGQALLALAIASDGIEFLRHQLAARHRDTESRSRPVVVRSLVAAGMVLTLGILAFLSLQDVAMLGEPSVRAGTVASSGQEAPEAAARSGGLPTQAERHAIISGPPPIAAMATAEPADTAGRCACPGRRFDNPAIDFGSCHCCSGPDRASARSATIRRFLACSVRKQATPPTTSPTISPPATQSLPNRYPAAAEIAALVARGDAFLSTGDIVTARLFYERAADGGTAAQRYG